MPGAVPALLRFLKRPTDTSKEDGERTELLKIANEAIYKQNFELSIRNKTLSVLRNLSNITMGATHVSDVTQQIVDTIVKELNFTAAIIALVDKQKNALRPVAMTNSPMMIEAAKLIEKPMHDALISLDDAENLAVRAIRDKQQKNTNNILDILTPLIDQKTADEMTRISNIKTFIIYPLLLADRPLGALYLGLSKNIDSLSRAEKETLSELIAVVTIAVDRAELLENIQKTNKDLASANEKLELLDKLKDEFVSVASHELRTPMTAIKSYVWLTLNGRGGQIDQKARDYLRRVYQSTERLIHLVNEMLDISRIESGRVTLNYTSFSVHDILSDIQREFQAKTTELSLKLTIDVADKIPPLFADREKIHQVMENLVGNACKFTDAGGTITLRARKEGDFIEIQIQDTGHGIKKEDMSKLFTKFGRFEHSLVTIAGSGSGLGLYISRQYVLLHGGNIWANSEIGKGSTFTFTLPVANTS